MNRKLAGLLALAMLAACGGGNAGSITPAAPGPQSANVSPSANGVHLTPFHGSPALANFEWGKAMLERMHFVAPTQVGALAVDVQVRMRDPHGLALYALGLGSEIAQLSPLSDAPRDRRPVRCLERRLRIRRPLLRETRHARRHVAATRGSFGDRDAAAVLACV